VSHWLVAFRRRKTNSTNSNVDTAGSLEFAVFVLQRMIMISISNNQAIARVTMLSDACTPVAAFHTLTHDTDSPAFILESAEGDNRLARFSFVGIDPCETISLSDGKATIVDRLQNNATTVETFGDPLAVFQSALQRHTGQADEEILPYPFSGGLVGYSGYALTGYFEGIPQQECDPFDIPEAFYGVFDAIVVFDHQFRQIHVVSRRGETHARQVAAKLRNPLPLPALPLPAGDRTESRENARGPLTPDEFKSLVAKAQGYIEEGQVFQIVLAQRFALPAVATAFDIYRILQAINPSPYAYLLRLPGFEYLGSSPETFVRCQEGEVLLRAIAGTRRRGKDTHEDAVMAEELLSSEKELAEHHMLVDLGRNDLGRVCKIGTVRCGELAQLIKYTHVMHLATEIKGQLAEGKTSFDVFRSCFPRGTVSGAPKVRAMQLLSGLEREQRGVYSGVVGYFDFRGNTDGAIAIRSALIKDGTAHVTAGAGIVHDSVPHEEYLETRNKARSVLQAIELGNLLAAGGN
jgi:anthranilate synthase component 1